MPEDENKNPLPSDEAAAATPGDEAEASFADASAGVNEDEIGQLLRKLDEVSAEAEAKRQDYLRAVADLDNYRKRALREKDEARLRGSQAVLEDLLPVLDNFSHGLAAARQHEAGKAFADGFAMILSQFENMLRQHGVEEVNPKGEAFDPNLHESVAIQADAEVPEGHVVEVQRVGYRYRERLLRAAVVVVSTGPAAGNAEAADGESAQSPSAQS